MNKVCESMPDYIEHTPLAISIYTAHRENTHFHKNAIELIFCIKGGVSVVTSYESLTISEGELLCINCNEVHCIHSDNDNLMISFHIHFDHDIFADRSLQHIILKLYPEDIEVHQKVSLKRLTDLLFSTLYIYTENYTTNKELYESISLQIVNILFENFTVYHVRNEDVDAVWSKERFERVLLYINTHYKEKLTLKSLSAMEHLNANYFSIYFNRIFLDTFNNYIAILRTYHSELELLTTDKNIAEIAYNYGFSDPKIYYRFFKKLYGRTPNSHRKWHHEYNSTVIDDKKYHVNEIRHTIRQYITYYFSKISLDLYNISIPDIEVAKNNQKNYIDWRTF